MKFKIFVRATGESSTTALAFDKNTMQKFTVADVKTVSREKLRLDSNFVTSNEQVLVNDKITTDEFELGFDQRIEYLADIIPAIVDTKGITASFGVTASGVTASVGGTASIGATASEPKSVKAAKTNTKVKDTKVKATKAETKAKKTSK